MPNFKYIGAECVYPNILIPGKGSLVAKPGDVMEFDTPPDPVWWVEESESKPLTPASQPVPPRAPAPVAPAKEVL